MARPRDPAIDTRIVDACVEMLGEVGRAGLSRAAIARRAEVSLPAVNRRFADVDEILLAVASSRHVGVRALKPEPEAATFRDWLASRLGHTIAVMNAQPTIRRQASELLAAACGNPTLDETFRASLAIERNEGLAAIERAKRAGEMRQDINTDALLDLVAAATYYRLIWRGEVLDTGEVESVVDLLVESTRPG